MCSSDLELALGTLRGTGGVVHQAADLVEKPIAGLGHLGRSGRCGGLGSALHNGDPGPMVQGRKCPSKALIAKPSHLPSHLP